jgi:hypothetical protein
MTKVAIAAIARREGGLETVGTIADGAWADLFPCLLHAINSNEHVRKSVGTVR